MNSTPWSRFLGIVSCCVIVFWANCADSQITQDGTLPNNSIVTPDGSTLNINGGTRAGSNLFHSFQQFSVPTGGTAIFNNAVDIQNIISRVTGGSISNIDSTIRASGTAVIFLINPSGIIIGRNASLNVGGSFVAANASAIKFGNQGSFSALNPNNPELLTINPSALLFNSNANQAVTILGQSPIRANLSLDTVNQVATGSDETLPPYIDFKIEPTQQPSNSSLMKKPSGSGFRLDVNDFIRLNLFTTETQSSQR